MTVKDTLLLELLCRGVDIMRYVHCRHLLLTYFTNLLW